MLQSRRKCVYLTAKTNQAMKKLVFLLLTVSLPGPAVSPECRRPFRRPMSIWLRGVTVFSSRLTDSGVGPLKVTAHGDSLSVESDGRRRGMVRVAEGHGVLCGSRRRIRSSRESLWLRPVFRLWRATAARTFS